MLILILGLVSCTLFNSQDEIAHYYYVYELEQGEVVANASQSQGKIAVVTHLNNIREYENVILLTVPDSWSWSRASSLQEEISSLTEEIIENEEIKVLIVSGGAASYYLVSGVKAQRDDIFVIYTSADSVLSRENESLIAMVDLTLDINRNMLIYSIIEQAKNLGAENFVAFVYDRTLKYDFDPDNFAEDEWEVEFIEEVNRIRARVEGIGLNFVEVRYAGIGCMSDLAQYMIDTMPGLVEELGVNTAFWGLGDDRLLWDAVARGTIYPSPFFDPSIYRLAFELYIPSLDEITRSFDQFFHRDNLRFVIEEIRNHLAERGMTGRVSSWPVNVNDMFVYAAIEYGFMLISDEVSAENVDILVLTQIMDDYIYRYTGESGLGVMGMFADSESYAPNHILFLMNFLVY